MTDCIPLSLDRLGDKAKQYGVSKLAKELGISRESIYRGFKDGANPRARVVLEAAKILGLKPHVEMR